MGTLLRAAIDADESLSLAGGYDADNVSELDSVAPAVDLVIDFSAPASLSHVEAYVRRTHAALLSGTTGLSADDLARLRALGEVAPVIWSGNYSLGVAVLRHLAREAAASLPGWDTEIVECHHNRKVFLIFRLTVMCIVLRSLRSEGFILPRVTSLYLRVLRLLRSRFGIIVRW